MQWLIVCALMLVALILMGIPVFRIMRKPAPPTVDDVLRMLQQPSLKREDQRGTMFFKRYYLDGDRRLIARFTRGNGEYLLEVPPLKLQVSFAMGKGNLFISQYLWDHRARNADTSWKRFPEILSLLPMNQEDD